MNYRDPNAIVSTEWLEAHLGISATVDLFLLHQLGYDASMDEWAENESLPIECG